MPNQFGLAGASPQKQTRYAVIYTGRWSSGIWTNRSPLRDATTSRDEEKYYGAAGDALIAGLNVEISNKLTLIRRPGNSVYDSNQWNAVDRFYDFHVFNANVEEIIVMVDQANALYSLQNGVQTQVWQKQPGAGQSYMQSVGNILYWGDGVSNKKWLQSLIKWTPNTPYNTPSTPYLSTYLIDPNGNIQQFTGASLTVTTVSATSDQVTVTVSGVPQGLTNVLIVGEEVNFPQGMVASWLDGQTVTVTQVALNSFTFNFAVPGTSYPTTPENANTFATIYPGDGTPFTGPSQPAWNLTVPSASNDFQGGLTQDGTVQWTNRGNPVENWGLANSTTAVTPEVKGSLPVWAADTYYSIPGVVLDSNGNLQQVTTAGLSATSGTPLWNTTLGGKTFDGLTTTGVTWTMIATQAMMRWQPDTFYPVGSFLVETPITSGAGYTLSAVAASSGAAAVYTGTITGGGSNAFRGQTYTISGFSNAANNGTFVCYASTSTTLTLFNASAVNETHAASAAGIGPACLFQSSASTGPYISGNVSAAIWASPHSSSGHSGVGAWDGISPYNTSNPATPPSGLPYPTNLGTALAAVNNLTGFDFSISAGGGGAFSWNTINSAGETIGSTNPFPGQNENLYIIIQATLVVPVSGNYTFVFTHGDGLQMAIGGGATFVSGTAQVNPQGVYSALGGYQYAPACTNENITMNGGAEWVDTVVYSLTAGTYPIEINMARWDKTPAGLTVTCNGNVISPGQPTGGARSGSTQPIWPAYTEADAPGYASVSESAGQLQWNNIGEYVDFTWQVNTHFTLPDTTIVDSNNNIESPFRTGATTSGSAPSWNLALDGLTLDNPNLVWVNLGPSEAIPTGSISTTNGGWKYAVALVNTLDDTVSNATPLSAATGNFENAQGVYLPPGAGLPPISQIDSQADWVAIFRTTDGQNTAFLIPGKDDFSLPVTLPLAQYLQSGYLDTTPDSGLNNLISAPVNGENTPPPAGAVNLTFFLGRLLMSVGATVQWTSGPSTPAGNGLNGVAPLNFDEQAAAVKRIVPTASGAFVFTVSNVNLMQGNSSTSTIITPSVAIPMLDDIGLLSYNALDISGSLIGLFTTDHQFVIFDPNGGVDSVGYPIGDQLRLNNGQLGQSWNPANVYVAYNVNGEDAAWYLSDGSQGWFRMMATPAPQSGTMTWSPFAQIVSGAGCVQSVEVVPGSRQLLVGPTGTGPILKRDLNVNSDNGTTYSANAVVGSAVLAQPGQIALVPFITVESTGTTATGIGQPLVLSVLIDEALPYYTGPFEVLKHWVNDPPNLRPSKSLPAQRFYLSEDRESAAACRHMQIRIDWGPQDFPSEIHTLSIFGGFIQEG